MPKGINPIRKALLKKNLLVGKSQAQALRDSGFADSTAHSRVGDNKSLKIAKEEILAEINKTDLAKKAYKTLENNLNAEKPSDRNVAAAALLDFTEGKKTEVTNKVPLVGDELKEFESLRRDVFLSSEPVINKG